MRSFCYSSFAPKLDKASNFVFSAFYCTIFLSFLFFFNFFVLLPNIPESFVVTVEGHTLQCKALWVYSPKLTRPLLLFILFFKVCIMFHFIQILIRKIQGCCNCMKSWIACTSFGLRASDNPLGQTQKNVDQRLNFCSASGHQQVLQCRMRKVNHQSSNFSRWRSCLTKADWIFDCRFWTVCQEYKVFLTTSCIITPPVTFSFSVAFQKKILSEWTSTTKNLVSYF
jgi:hypothetical protein